jgi:predicted nucleic acid-binding protein
MTRFVVDPSAVLHLATSEWKVAASHRLLAPTVLRSQTLSLLHEAVHRAEIEPAEGQRRLALVGRLKIRYLGDAVLRRRAWDIAERLGLGPTYDAEYLALTQLQGEALVTLDPRLARLAEGIVELAPIESLRSSTG